MHSYKATYRMALAILISFYQYHRQPRNCHLKLCFCLCSDAPFQSKILIWELLNLINQSGPVRGALTSEVQPMMGP